MTAEQVGRLLQRFPVRGLIFFRLLLLGSVIGFGILINVNLIMGGAGGWKETPVSWGWCLFCFLLATTSSVGWVHARRQYARAWLVASDPAVVYWAHAAGSRGPEFERSTDDCTSLTLHLRIGKHLDVQLPAPEMRELTAWLREKNPDIRWGYCDELGIPDNPREVRNS